MTQKLRKAARAALAATDWAKLGVLTDDDIARQIGANPDAAPDAAPDMAPAIDVRAIGRANGMTQAEFAAAYESSVRTVQE